MYIFSAFADEYSDNFIEQCEGMKFFNINYIEIRHADGKNISEMNANDLKEIKIKLDYYGLKISAIGSPLGKIKLSDDFEAHLDLTKKMCETANYLETQNIRMFSFYPNDGEDINKYRDQVLSNLSKMLDVADSYNVTLCHENESDIYGESAENCLDLYTYFSPRLKLVFDFGNYAIKGHDVQKAYELLKGKIEYFHIKDASPKSGVFLPAGYGVCHMEEILDDYSHNMDHPTFLTLEPHLVSFVGLSSIAHKEFNILSNFKDNKEAFEYAKKCLHKIIERPE